jgi:acyloxyacyl hydrolase
MRNLFALSLFIVLLACPHVMPMTYQPNPDSVIAFLKANLPLAKMNSEFNSYFGENNLRDDGNKCWICAMIMGTMIKYVSIHGLSLDDFLMNHFCTMFPTNIQAACNGAVKTFGPTIINSIIQHGSADQACRDIKFCSKPECNLFPSKSLPKVKVSEDWPKYFEAAAAFEPWPPVDWKTDLTGPFELKDEGVDKFNIFELSAEASKVPNAEEHEAKMAWVQGLIARNGVDPIEWLKEMLAKISKDHVPPLDVDGDKFSVLTAELRGYNWRGKDCNDNNAKIYPGRKNNPNGLNIDYNCNGIVGLDRSTGQTYKDKFCKNSGQMGVVVIGDSAGAHAEAPTQWVNASQWTNQTFNDTLISVENEVDLPHMSGYTGYMETGYTGPVSSVYKNLYQRNKCNFRDYQNIAVNGLSSNSALGSIKALARNVTEDFPLLIFLELIGNDVCGHEQSFDHMTKPENFRKNIKTLLDNLDQIVPPGSHLVAIGLVNGSKIYEGVKDRIHPVGVSYPDLYDYQNCLDASFCWGWLNTNQTVRDTTTKIAESLSAQYNIVFSNYTAKNFDFVYYDFPTQAIWDEWVAEGNDPYLLIEPTDGFHPSQIFHAKLGEHLWKFLQDERPAWLGAENPYNDQITQLFGDQGGY